jgi:hypothetical protein
VTSKNRLQEDVSGCEEKPRQVKDTPVSPQRRFPRFQFHEKVRIGITTGTEPTYVDGRGVDLAEGGLGASTSARLEVGDTVHLQIPLASDSLHLPARVCYRYGPEYGFEFVGLGIPEREYIRKSCKSLMQIG